jgi:hypothetical protein
MHSISVSDMLLLIGWMTVPGLCSSSSIRWFCGFIVPLGKPNQGYVWHRGNPTYPWARIPGAPNPSGVPGEWKRKKGKHGGPRSLTSDTGKAGSRFAVHTIPWRSNPTRSSPSHTRASAAASAGPSVWALPLRHPPNRRRPNFFHFIQVLSLPASYSMCRR